MDQVMSIEAALAVADEVSPTPARAVTALKVMRAALSHVGHGSALMAFLEERLRQVNVEGYTPERDDLYLDGELAYAAGTYALTGGGVAPALAGLWWPWHEDTFKPANPKRDLVRAGALLIAAYERVQRAEKANG